MVQLLLITFALVLFAFFLFSLRLIFLKKGEFRGTCANNNPMLLKAGAVCGVCGKKAGEVCENQD